MLLHGFSKTNHMKNMVMTANDNDNSGAGGIQNISEDGNGDDVNPKMMMTIIIMTVVVFKLLVMLTTTTRTLTSSS